MKRFLTATLLFLMTTTAAHAALHEQWKAGRRLRIRTTAILVGEVPKVGAIRLWADPPPPAPKPSPVFPVTHPTSPAPAPTSVVFTGSVPSWFWSQAMCIHSFEGSWTDPGAPYYGGMQFLLSTWQRAGGQGYPNEASPSEQVYRAYQIWQMDGGSWSEWSTAPRCGLG